MKAVILAGGLGTRISEETHLKPKPMVEIGGKPILWHIMKIYSHHGINDFIICLGYKGYVIKEYFANYFLHMSDVTFDMSKNEMIIHQNSAEPWKVTLVDTGEETMTGGRLKRVTQYIGEGTFCFTYGDGVSNVNIRELLQFHKKHGKLATVTTVHPPGRFGELSISNNQVVEFKEKPQWNGNWINGGFFVLQPEIISFIEGDEVMWEKEPIETLAKNNELVAYQHRGFWQPMDTLRDRMKLEEMWKEEKAPWKVW
ncbi:MULTISPECIES: glucose-1-phosphate cytidylyltransferase [Peribacillus]|uniref:glucose-1-phosphate cytidylyltransferase n=1 Tax=Peribacillus TaxID=2675229 RepID=UPI0020418DDB|nr:MULTISPECIES: glucose-1-phosphate cytidylyltransferase [Peribacillus]MCM3677503.1 glucose-1-phosphate cytidylyltransferase [Peribacillus simplex]MDQ0883819.1 glucose-1-phosphate cytidylyltransferase [Peribacillus sp. V2I11]